MSVRLFLFKQAKLKIRLYANIVKSLALWDRLYEAVWSCTLCLVRLHNFPHF